MTSTKLNSGFESYCRKAMLAATATISFIGIFGATAAKADTPVFPFIKPIVACEVMSTSTLDNPGFYGIKGKDGNPLPAGSPVTYPDLVLFKAYCWITNASDPKVVDTVAAIDTIKAIKFPACATTTGNVCTYYQRAEVDVVLKENRTLVAEFLIQNRTNMTATIKPDDIVGETSQGDEAPAPSQFTAVTWKPNETPIYAPVNNASCRVVVSGASEPIPENVENPLVQVANGKLVFQASITGISGVGSEIASIKWTGGPDQSGLWENPPLKKESLVTAQVTIKAGQTLTCGIRVVPAGEGFTVGLSRFGDCRFFGSTRSYYYRTADNKSIQTSGYDKPLQFVGLPIKYGVNGPDIPFRGVVNGAFSKQDVLETGTNGDVVTPPASERKYSGAVVVVRTFDNTTSKVSEEPVAWGKLDYSNYSATRLEQLQNIADEESVVVQVYLAASQVINDGTDLRGSTLPGAIPYHSFRPGTADNKPYDRIVPFVNNSCGVMTIPVPARSDKGVTPDMQALKMCTFSKSYKYSELKSGRVTLDVMHVVAEHGEQTFPANLLKSMNKPGNCNANSAPRECWNVTASNLGIAKEGATPFTAHDSCRVVTVVNTPSQVCGGSNGCTTVNVPTTIETYKPGCNVTEPQECGPAMAVRFSGYNQMMLGALGCAVKYDRPGENVTATLLNQGIIPYTSFGGSAPKHYSTYPSAHGQTNGYACIPCRFDSDAVKAGQSLEGTTAVLPVDQDSTTARKPVYSFTKSTAPRDCVKDVSFEVRYFGSSACDGVNAPPGHFCNSSNLQQQNCSTSDNGTAQNPFSGGGNVAGKFSVPICPGSGIEYESVSVSWSPIILDIAGNGISITRSFDMARQFDIRGDNRLRVLDWPLNNDEVAFLVRPNKGKVTSIKELFGDYKAKNGFEAMRKLDSNKDGVLNRKDKAFAELGLWFDRNRNAKLDAGELEPLDVNGVFEVPLVYAKPNRKGAEGRTLTGVYFNHKQQRYMNIEDHYFYEYISSGQKMSQK